MNRIVVKSRVGSNGILQLTLPVGCDSGDLYAEWFYLSGDLHAGGVTGGTTMIRDPIVEEVRAVREQLAAQFDFDIRKIIADARKRQAESKSQTVSFEGSTKRIPVGYSFERSVSES